MKRIISFILTTLIMFTLAACGSSNPTQNSGTPTSAPPSTPNSIETPASGNATPAGDAPASGNSGTNILVAYFSVPENVSTDGVDAVSGASVVVKNGEKLGDTQYLAQMISENSGGDLFRIETVQQYPTDHAPLLDFAKEEQNKNARPELLTHMENMDGYDVIFLGYPNWWADLPQPLYTFLEEYDFAGKTIIPFCPHGGSGFSRTINTIAELQPNATVEKNGFSVSRNSVPNAESDMIEWVKELGYYNIDNNISSSPVQVTLTVGNSVVTAELDDSEIARQFAALLPQTISMTRGRDREYYGRINGTLSFDEDDIQTTAEDGDLAYWFSGNSLAFFFNTENDSAVNSGIVVFGKITSDLSVFNNMSSGETVTVTLLE